MPDDNTKEDKPKDEKLKLTQEEKEKRELFRKEKTPASMMFRAQTALTSHFDDATSEEVVITTVIKGLDEDDQVDLKVIAETNKNNIVLSYANAHKEKDVLMIFTKEETKELLTVLTRALAR